MKIELIGSNLLPPLAQPVNELPAFGMGRRTSVMRYVFFLSLSLIYLKYMLEYIYTFVVYIFLYAIVEQTLFGKNILSLHI